MDETDKAPGEAVTQIPPPPPPLPRQRAQEFGTQAGPGPVGAPAESPVEAQLEAPAPVHEDHERANPNDTHFDTPSWLGPDRHPELHQIPEQYRPAPPPAAVPVARDRVVINQGHWAEHPKPRVLVGLLLTISLATVIGALVATIISQSAIAIAVLVAASVITVVLRGGLMSSGAAVVDLRGSRLEVRRDGIHELFDLTDPSHLVELVGRPGDSFWRLRLEKSDGSLIELDSSQVDPEQLHPAVEHYRAIADRERREREQRFNR